MTPSSSNGVSRIILGVDPGSNTTGYGFLRSNGNRLEVMAFGAITPRPLKSPLGNRLKVIFEELESLIDENRPDVIAVETVFSHINVQSAIGLAQARGVILLAAARQGVQTTEFAPREVKLAVTGFGGADKIQVRSMVSRLLGLKASQASSAGSGPAMVQDAFDALAVAYCEASSAPMRLALANAGVARLRARSRR